MGYIDDVKQKAEGIVDEIKGEINQKRQKGVKGGMQKIKGKTKQYIADSKLKARHEGAKGDWEADWNAE